MCDREVYNGKQRFVPELILKKPRGSDCFLEFENMKEEWLVIANNWVAVNVAEVRYTSPVVPRELLGLKSGLITLARFSFTIFLC
jgi:hypothetical protein